MPDNRYQHSTEPFDWITAVAASRAAGEAQHNAERFLKEQTDERAAAEQAYREALSKRIVELRSSGTPATVAQTIARGESQIATLRHTRDVKDGMVKAAEQSIWRHTADRRDLEQLLDWSKRVSLLDQQVHA